MARRKALGRGIDALLSDMDDGPVRRHVKLGVDQIKPLSIGQPRKRPHKDLDELVASIKEEGVLQPLWVRKKGKGYEIIAGERRWRAAQRAGLHEVPALLFEEVSDEHALVLALVENLQREDLNPIEEAESFSRLTKDFGMTQEQVAARVGKDRSTVANSLRLLALPGDVRDMVADGQISPGHARALLSLKDAAKIRKAAKEAAKKGLSVRDVEAKVSASRTRRKKPDKKYQENSSPQVRGVVERLQRVLGTKVKITDRGGKGCIEIMFSSVAERERLIQDLLSKRP